MRVQHSTLFKIPVKKTFVTKHVVPVRDHCLITVLLVRLDSCSIRLHKLVAVVIRMLLPNLALSVRLELFSMSLVSNVCRVIPHAPSAQQVPRAVQYAPIHIHGHLH